MKEDCGIRSAGTSAESLQSSPINTQGTLKRVDSTSSVCDRLFSHQDEQHHPHCRRPETAASTRGSLLNVVMTGVRLTLLGV